MYGYFSFPKDSKWFFYVDTKVGYAEEIKQALTFGKKRIGRSRSAEYGLVDISFVTEVVEKENIQIKGKELLIYAESNLCFYDIYGQNTLQPTIEQLNLPADSIVVWDKSQIRTRKYQTWNGKRYNRDADRMIIEKGSVFFIELKSELNSEVFNNGIGSHKNEGFGQILLNPEFLISDTEIFSDKFEEQKDYINSKYPILKGLKDDLLQNYLEGQEAENKREIDIDKLVNSFKSKNEDIYNGITASQWGQVRNYAKHAANETVLKKLLFLDGTGYFKHGQSESKWRAKSRSSRLEAFIFGETNSPSAIVPEGSKIEFTQKLAAEMGKYAKSKNKKS